MGRIALSIVILLGFFGYASAEEKGEILTCKTKNDSMSISGDAESMTVDCLNDKNLKIFRRDKSGRFVQSENISKNSPKSMFFRSPFSDGQNPYVRKGNMRPSLMFFAVPSSRCGGTLELKVALSELDGLDYAELPTGICTKQDKRAIDSQAGVMFPKTFLPILPADAAQFESYDYDRFVLGIGAYNVDLMIVKVDYAKGEKRNLKGTRVKLERMITWSEIVDSTQPALACWPQLMTVQFLPGADKLLLSFAEGNVSTLDYSNSDKISHTVLVRSTGQQGCRASARRFVGRPEGVSLFIAPKSREFIVVEHEFGHARSSTFSY